MTKLISLVKNLFLKSNHTTYEKKRRDKLRRYIIIKEGVADNCGVPLPFNSRQVNLATSVFTICLDKEAVPIARIKINGILLFFLDMLS